MNWLKENWWRLLFFTLWVAVDAFMDHLNFHVPHDSGWWSLHTEGYRGPGSDAWHTFKLLGIFFVVLGMVGKSAMKHYVLLFFAILNYFTHEILLHKIFKKKD